MDIAFNTDDGRHLASRSCAIIRNDDKFLIMRNKYTVKKGFDNWHIPGGHIQVGEDSKTCVEREIKEELGIDIVIKNLFSFIENFYYSEKTGKNNHAFEFCYSVEPVGKIETSLEEKMEIKWVTVEELRNIDLRPVVLKDLILSGDFNKTHFDIICDRKSGK